MRTLLTPDRVVIALSSALLGMLLNVISNWVSAEGGLALNLLVAAFLLSGIIAVFYMARATHIQVRMGQAIALRSDADRRREARKGLIVFISAYNPLKDENFRCLPEEEKKAKMAEFRAAAQALDYTRLNLELSNLEPAIRAVQAHSARLEHCWLIATAGKNGSHVFAPVLEKYLVEKLGIKKRQGNVGCQFHYGEPYQVSIDKVSETEVVDKTRRLVEVIFKEAHRAAIHLPDKEIIADITSGTRNLVLGMILACQDSQRDLQFMGTQYDPDTGRPVGELLPIVFNFEPQFVRKE
jgi:hypothetical protein